MVNVFWVDAKYILDVVQNILMYKKMYCDTILMWNILCGCGWKERNNLNSWWHKTPRYQTIVHHEFWGHQKSTICCLFFCSGVFCLFTSLWCLKFTIQWRWTFPLTLVMEWVCCYNWVGSWMRNAHHVCGEIGWRKGELKRYKLEKLGLQGGKFFEL